MSTIKEHEGLRTSAYLDPVGIPTICYGHTGPEVRLGLRYTRAGCDAILMEDIRVHWTGLQGCITRPLTPNQRDAVISFGFNVGVAKACRSTLVRKINAGDYPGAAAEFPKWRYAKVSGRNVALRGLTRRREAEAALFTSQTGTVAATQQFAALTQE